MSQVSREALAGSEVMVWSMRARRSDNEAPSGGQAIVLAS